MKKRFPLIHSLSKAGDVRVTFAHLCDHAMVSKEGKLSVIGIFSRIQARDLPTTHLMAYLAFELELTHAEVNRDFQVRVDLVNPDGRSLFRTDATVRVDGPAKVGARPRFGQVIPLPAVRFDTTGPHSINIWLDGRPDRSVEFEVARIQDPRVAHGS